MKIHKDVLTTHGVKADELGTVDIEWITPEIAKVFLEGNEINRNISKKGCGGIVRDLKNGLWDIGATPEITFDVTGRLLDGQYRLTAIIESGVPAALTVHRGAPIGTHIFDVGTKRSRPDIWKMKTGRSMSTAASGTVNTIIRDCFPTIEKVTDEIAIKFYEETEPMIRNAERICQLGTENARAKQTPCMAATYYALRNGVKESCLEEFFRAVNTGNINGPKETSAARLRDYLDKYRVVNKRNAEKRLMIRVTECYIEDWVNETPRKQARKKFDPSPYRDYVKTHDRDLVGL